MSICYLETKSKTRRESEKITKRRGCLWKEEIKMGRPGQGLLYFSLIFKIYILLIKIKMNTNEQKQKEIKGHLRCCFWNGTTLGGGLLGEGLRGTGQLPNLRIASQRMLQGSFFAWKNPNSSLGQGQYFSCFLFFWPQHKPSMGPGIYWARKRFGL